MAIRAAARNLSVREVEAAVKTANKKAAFSEDISVTPKVNYLADLEDKVTTTLGRRCRIVNTAKKKTIQLEFTDDDDLQELLTAICGKAPIED